MTQKEIKQLNSKRLETQYQEQADYSYRQADRMYYLRLVEEEKKYQTDLVA